MRLHPEGRKVIGVTFLVLAALSFLVYRYVNIRWLQFFFFLGFFIEFSWTVAFFRFPNRKINKGVNNILASADGEVVVIEDTFEKEYECLQASYAESAGDTEDIPECERTIDCKAVEICVDGKCINKDTMVEIEYQCVQIGP